MAKLVLVSFYKPIKFLYIYYYAQQNSILLHSSTNLYLLQGYENPLWLLFASMVFCMLYISLILPESVILQDTSIFRRLG